MSAKHILLTAIDSVYIQVKNSPAILDSHSQFFGPRWEHVFQVVESLLRCKVDVYLCGPVVRNALFTPTKSDGTSNVVDLMVVGDEKNLATLIAIFRMNIRIQVIIDKAVRSLLIERAHDQNLGLKAMEVLKFIPEKDFVEQKYDVPQAKEIHVYFVKTEDALKQIVGPTPEPDPKPDPKANFRLIYSDMYVKGWTWLWLMSGDQKPIMTGEKTTYAVLQSWPASARTFGCWLLGL
jgi:hypothetical protein